MFRIHHCILFAAALLVSCSAEPPSTTIASAVGPSCQRIDAISTEHQAKVETAASASYQLVAAGARSDIGGEATVQISFTDQPRNACGSIQRTAVCFAGLAVSADERAGIQRLWAPIIADACASPSSVPSPDLVIPPSASSAVLR